MSTIILLIANGMYLLRNLSWQYICNEFTVGTILSNEFTGGTILSNAFTVGTILSNAFTDGTVLSNAFIVGNIYVMFTVDNVLITSLLLVVYMQCLRWVAHM